jgi:hypothetical protein
MEVQTEGIDIAVSVDYFEPCARYASRIAVCGQPVELFMFAGARTIRLSPFSSREFPCGRDITGYSIRIVECDVDFPGCFGCPIATTCFGDANGDRCVNQSDLGILLQQFNLNYSQPEYTGCADFDCDGDVDSSDLGIILAAYGECCAGGSCLNGQACP